MSLHTPMVFYHLLIGTTLSILLTWGALRIFPKMGLLDFPHRYQLKRPRLPYPGGLIFALCAVGFCALNEHFRVLVPALLVLGGISFIDDRHPISPFIRLLLQLNIASYVYWSGIQIDFIGNPFRETNFELGAYPVISFWLTIIWIVVVQNALNWFDGLKGLAPGVSGVGFLTLGILGLVRPELFFDPAHQHLTLANFFFAGATLGGWWWFWKGKIILGDTGSQVLGFLLAVMSIFSGAKIGTTIIVLGLPLLDAVFVVFRRVFKDKKSPFSGDLFHLHHNLARKMGESKASVLLVGISAGLGAGAVFLTGISKLLALIVVSFLVLELCRAVGQKS